MKLVISIITITIIIIIIYKIIIKKQHEKNIRLQSNLSKVNGKGHLKIKVCRGDKGQNVHPSLIYFEKAWNGYKYWLAITPYKKEREKLENPSIMCSDDLINWKEPQKGINPLVSTTNVSQYHYSDPQLVFCNEALELWYRKRTRGKLGNSEVILRRKSYDGVNWEKEEELYCLKGTYNQFMSPVVIFEDNKYCIWVIDWSNKCIKYYESKSGEYWIFIRDISINPVEGRYVWHMDIKRTKKGYEMYFSAALEKYDDQKMAYCYSKDNISWSNPVIVMEKGPVGNFDEDIIYRPSFIDIEGIRYIMYSARDTKNNWHCGLTTCKVDNPIELFGVVIES